MSSRSPQVILSPQAQEDFEDILLKSEMLWGDEQADAYEEAIDHTLRSLGDFPELGHPRDDLFKGCRSHPVERHIIYYSTIDRTVTIARILHRRMDASSHVKG